jgi:hypothetical protein
MPTIDPFGSYTQLSISDSAIATLIRNGQGYSVTVGNLTGPASVSPLGLSLFASSIAKSILIFSAKFYYNANTAGHQLNLTTSNPSLAGGNLTARNLQAGGPASLLTAGMITFLNAGGGSVSGNALDFFGVSSTSITECIVPGSAILLPAGAANGLALFIASTAATLWTASMKWVEY